MPDKKLTIGILAHVDAGKTSLTEGFLFAAGATSSRGSVDQGSAITDGLAMERDRGISIKAATVDLEWKDTHINIVDTPGHVDFSAEVDRALSVLDKVILVVSAVEGVQAHTLSLWDSIRERGIPVTIFVNKIDRMGADVESVYREIERDLRVSLFARNYAEVRGPDQVAAIPIHQADQYLSKYIIDKSIENLADLDEGILEAYLDGNLPDMSALLEKSNHSIQQGDLVSIIFGSAKLGFGIDHLLDDLIRYPVEPSDLSNDLIAKIFKVEYDRKWGRLAYVRIFSGEIKTKDVLPTSGAVTEIKVNQIYQRRLGKLVQVDRLSHGDIGLLSSSQRMLAGDVVGGAVAADKYTSITESVLGIQVVATDDKDYQALGNALEIFNIEDPRLDLQWYKDDREYHLKILGPMQVQVLQDSLAQRFDIDADFLPPDVIYKETPKSAAEGFVRYWMPKPCWAIMRFRVEPGEIGSGVVYASEVRTSDISTKYQNEVVKAIPWSLRQGIKGWEVTDIRITLVEGSEHQVHSNPGDFLLATPMGVMRGIEAADTVLLEPIYDFEIKAPTDMLGSVASDLTQMQATIGSPIFDGEFFVMKGTVAVAKAIDYSIKFSATTSGKGRLKLSVSGYQQTDVSTEKIRPYRGVSPLDESLWILHNRGAFKAESRVR